MGYLRDLDILHQIVSRLKMLKEATQSRSSLPSAQILTLGIVQPRVVEVGHSGSQWVQNQGDRGTGC